MTYWSTFVHLLSTPLQHIELVWGIGPLYFGWILNELTSDKTSFHTALQTGFSFLWAGAHWTWLYFHRSRHAPNITLDALLAVNVAVTLLVLLIGLAALISGIRRSFPKYGSFLGHARFSNYFMILIYPMQSNYLPWTWHRVETIALFAIPVWLVCRFGFQPLRK